MASTTSFNVPGDFGADAGPYFRSPFSDNPQGTSSYTPEPRAPTPAAPAAPEPHENQDEPKTCRICFDTSTSEYDPEVGRLLSPCRCRGSSKYVHEGCLNQWRIISANSKSYYECNTCGYKYKFRRLAISRWVGSRGLQLSITSAILLLTIYILGFVADPIINAYLSSPSLPSPPPQFRPLTAPITEEATPGALPAPKPGTLAEHMLKGITSLGLLGFIKVIFFLGPNSWWNLRQSGILGNSGGRTSSGRDRCVEFFVWVWKKVSVWTRGWLDKAVEEIMDVDEDPAEGKRDWVGL
ncbi:RING finger domain-containing protein [Tirmania nivea]|nr:RING finger domain-containing protein [Tirmania nivea]